MHSSESLHEEMAFIFFLPMLKVETIVHLFFIKLLRGSCNFSVDLENVIPYSNYVCSIV